MVRRALVTGATGFVGRHLALALRMRGWQVDALVRPESPLADALSHAGVTTIALASPQSAGSAIDESRPDVVFHLAAHHVRHRDRADLDPYLVANIAIGAHLLEAVSDRGGTVVNAMSYFQFRNGAAAPHSLYAATKQAYAEIAAYYRECAGVDSRDVVLYDNYGPGDTRDKLVPALLHAAREGSAVTTGPLEQQINLLYVEDVVAGLIAAASEGGPAIVTVRAPRTTSVGEVIDVVQRATGTTLRHSVDPARRVDDHSLVAGDWPAPAGWTPRWSLGSGIGEAYAATM